jgi:two-component system sensor histidine kinase AlgZ
MAELPPADTAAPSRPAGLGARGWPSTQHGDDTRPSSFGATLRDPAASRAPLQGASVFDVCHVGLVLRAVLLVHAAVAVGVAFVAAGLLDWFGLIAVGAAIALPGVLFWLVSACALKRPLGALPPAWQWVAAVALGAVAGGFGPMLWWLTGLEAIDARLPRQSLAAMLAGAAGAALVFQWLRMRAKAALPVETTARLAELQSRIRPHFLFNTLNTALALVRVDPTRAEEVLEDLAELFRVALSDHGASVSLGEEVELARRYLAIEQIRFGERLSIDWQLDEQAAGARVPPLLLQPLVENAVRHGVEPSDRGGTIRIRTRASRGRALISIDNSLPDVPSQPGNGIALKNVRERLRLMHDVAAAFETQREATRFRVQIAVPL